MSCSPSMCVADKGFQNRCNRVCINLTLGTQGDIDPAFPSGSPNLCQQLQQ